MQEKITYNNLPMAVSEIYTKLENLEKLLIGNQSYQSPPVQDQLLTVEQAAAFLHIQRSTIYSKVSKGKLPSMKQFGRLYFSRAELIAYAKAGKRKTIAETQLEAQKYINSKEGVYNA